jgi:deoxyribodipyrimidine photo-lyase
MYNNQYMFNVVWFKRDARVHDHAPLAAAVATGLPVLPLYVNEPAMWQLPTASGRQWAAQREALSELAAELATRGSPLVVRTGVVVEILEALYRRHGPFNLWAHAETFTDASFARDIAVRRWARTRGLKFTDMPQFGIRRPHKSREGWAGAWEACMRAPQVAAPVHIQPLAGVVPGGLPAWPTPLLTPDPCSSLLSGRQPGGRRAALTLLSSFTTGRGRAAGSPFTWPTAA